MTAKALFWRFFYLLAWYPTLGVVEALKLRWTKPSFLIQEPARYARMAMFSVPAWLLYEALNLRLKNWEYWGLPEPLGLRWAGYALAFATVLPAILSIADLIEVWLPSRQPRPLTGQPHPKICVAAGALCLALPMTWPRIFFPLIWGAAFLLLEPWGRLLSRPRKALSLLVSGLLCGLLWELYNYWAGAKWVYTVPWPKGPKLFEMPLLGYLGFPPFALGCGSLWEAFDVLWESGPTSRPWLAGSLCLFSLGTFWAIDRYTARSFVYLGG